MRLGFIKQVEAAWLIHGGKEVLLVDTIANCHANQHSETSLELCTIST